MSATGLVTDRHDGLVVQRQSALFYCPLDLHHPLHFRVAAFEFGIVVAKNMDPISALVLCRVARRVGGAEHVNDAGARAANWHETDAHTEIEALTLRHEPKLLDGGAQSICHDHCFFQVAILHQDAELVAAKPGDCVALTHLLYEHAPELPQ